MALLVDAEGNRHELGVDGAVIGRDPVNDIVVAGDRRVSRVHAEVRQHEGRWLLTDLGSRDGTRVNGLAVTAHPLAHDDRIVVGTTELRFAAEGDPQATEAGPGSLAVGATGPAGRLSAREREVVALVAAGCTDRQIADQLCISASTVRSHLDRVADKTGLRRRSELTRFAIEAGLDR